MTVSATAFSTEPATAERCGVLAAGHWIMDRGCLIESWPEQDTIALISGETTGNGGGAYNLLKDLAQLQCGFPLQAAGLLGDDADGRAIVEDCAVHGIDTSRMSFTAQAPTSYCYVFTASDTGRRTFFHQKGANQFLAQENIDLRSSNARIIYLGYLGMLDKMDRLDDDLQTGASRLFRQAQESGTTTVADLCSNTRSDMPSIVGPSLPFVDYLFLNEFEARQLAGGYETEVWAADRGSLVKFGQQILDRGVREAVVVHVPDGVVCVQRGGPTLVQGSVLVPPSEIRGTAGAGDALAAGFVFGLHEGWPREESLALAVSSAAASLQDPSCSASIPGWKSCLAWGEARGFRTLN